MISFNYKSIYLRIKDIFVISLGSYIYRVVFYSLSIYYLPYTSNCLCYECSFPLLPSMIQFDPRNSSFLNAYTLHIQRVAPSLIIFTYSIESISKKDLSCSSPSPSSMHSSFFFFFSSFIFLFNDANIYYDITLYLSSMSSHKSMRN